MSEPTYEPLRGSMQGEGEARLLGTEDVAALVAARDAEDDDDDDEEGDQ